MPDISGDRWYRAEVVPPNLALFIAGVRTHYNLPASHVGAKGNPLTHFRGAHRSRAFIKNSPFCTNRTYTVSRTAGDRAGGDDNWLAGVDITFRTRAQLLAACRRLDAAVRAGLLEKITEWYGNTDDDQRVDGYDNIANAVASSDASHLWHLHLTIDRGRVNEDHSDLLAIITGDTMGDETDVTEQTIWQLLDKGLRPATLAQTSQQPKPGGKPGETYSRPNNWLVCQLLELREAITALRTSPPAPAPVVLTTEQLDELAERIVARLPALRFVASDGG